MKRPLSERERHLLVSTLGLMRTGEHESRGPYYNRKGEIVVPEMEPTPEDPAPFLGQVDALKVVRETGCSEWCFDCGRSLSRPACCSVFFVTEEERGAFPDQLNGGSGTMIAEVGAEDGTLVFIFANAGVLTELEMC